jgi:hypothetical protein
MSGSEGGREVQQSVVTNFSQDGEITQHKNQRLGKAAKYQVLSLAEQFRERGGGQDWNGAVCRLGEDKDKVVFEWAGRGKEGRAGLPLSAAANWHTVRGP